MRKAHTLFEQVPIDVAEKALEQEKLLTQPNGNCELIVENSGTSIKSQTPSRKPKVSAA
jgi:hypothetical protein